MSLFRRNTPPAGLDPVEPAQQQQQQQSPPAAAPPMFTGGTVDMKVIYDTARIPLEERERVNRGAELLSLLPSSATGTREVVEATFKAFGVDARKILDAANKQLATLESFIRFSHDQTQAALDAGERRIADLEAEIERSRQAMATATREGEERARTVNLELQKVQRVLEFFGSDADAEMLSATELEESTVTTPATRATEPTEKA